MTTSAPPRAGTCPLCDARIATSDVRIEYVRDGSAALYAECPRCQGVVDPT